MTVGITELPPEGMQLPGVALAGDPERGTKTTEGISLLFTTAGVTVQGPQPQIERLLVWSALDSATCREKIQLPDGREAAIMELTSGGQSIRFLLPSDTVSPGQAAYLDQALPAWLLRYKGVAAPTAAPAPAPAASDAADPEVGVELPPPGPSPATAAAQAAAAAPAPPVEATGSSGRGPGSRLCRCTGHAGYGRRRRQPPGRRRPWPGDPTSGNGSAPAGPTNSSVPRPPERLRTAPAMPAPPLSAPPAPPAPAPTGPPSSPAPSGPPPAASRPVRLRPRPCRPHRPRPRPRRLRPGRRSRPLRPPPHPPLRRLPSSRRRRRPPQASRPRRGTTHRSDWSPPRTSSPR